MRLSGALQSGTNGTSLLPLTFAVKLRTFTQEIHGADSHNGQTAIILPTHLR